MELPGRRTLGPLAGVGSGLISDGGAIGLTVAARIMLVGVIAT